MYAETFEFNGIKSEDAGFYIMSFGGSGELETNSIGNEITFATTQAARSDTQDFHGATRTTPLSITFQIGLNPCQSKVSFLDREKCAFLLRWLERKDGYKLLRFFQDGYENTFFKAKIHIEWIQFLGQIIGAELTVTCNAPYGYSELKTFEATVTNNGSFSLYNDSDEYGKLDIEKTTITLTEMQDTSLAKGTFSFGNQLDSQYTHDGHIDYFTVENCKENEIIVIDSNGNLSSTMNTYHTNESVSSDCNYEIPHLLNLSDGIEYSASSPYETYSENRINTFITDTDNKFNYHILFEYRTIRSVMC